MQETQQVTYELSECPHRLNVICVITDQELGGAYFFSYPLIESRCCQFISVITSFSEGIERVRYFAVVFNGIMLALYTV
jgi:hypothetical protein